MTETINAYTVRAAGTECRVWEKGTGEPLVFFGGLGGVPKWTPFLDALASSRRVIVPSPPGFPGSADGHKGFSSYLDWITATLDILDGLSEVDRPDVVGASVGGLLAAELAAIGGERVRKLVLISPFGIYDTKTPGVDPFAVVPNDIPLIRSNQPARFAEAFSPPADASPTEWAIMLNRVEDASARILWPFGDRGLAQRLHRITQPTLLLWGSHDKILPPAYADKYAALITGDVQTKTIDGAGHLAAVDQPDIAAEHVLAFLSA